MFHIVFVIDTAYTFNQSHFSSHNQSTTSATRFSTIRPRMMFNAKLMLVYSACGMPVYDKYSRVSLNKGLTLSSYYTMMNRIVNRYFQAKCLN